MLRTQNYTDLFSSAWHNLKNHRFINAEIAEGAEFKTRAFQSTLGFSNASAFSAINEL